MKKLNKTLSLILCISMVLNFTLPNFATNKDALESTSIETTLSSSDFDFSENDDSVIEEENDTETSKDATNNDKSNENISSEDIESIESTSEEPENDETTSIEQSDDTQNLDIENTTTDIEPFEEEIEIVASTSETNETTYSLGLDNYAKLNTVEQFNYLVEDSAKLVDNTIVLLKDVTLFDTVRFLDNLNLDMNGFSITAPDDNYALYIENNFTLIDSSIKGNDDASGTEDIDEEVKVSEPIINSSIKSVNPSFPVIYAKNAIINLGKTNIIASDGKCGGDAIHLFNSDIYVDGTIIKGGNGLDNYEDAGGDGGNAIVVYKSTNDNVIKVNDGFVYGGKGGKGIGDETPDTGASISYNGIYQGGTKVGKGLKGKKGGGNGGIAINILSKDFDLNKLSFEPMTLFEGSAGSSIIKTENNNEQNKNTTLFGDADEEVSRHYYSLYDLDGKNYLTSLKDQSDFGLCAVYAICAQAETYMMMEFPDFVKNVCGKVTETIARTFPDRNEEINLSEVYFGLATNKTPTDAFGNAGHSDAGNTDGWTWGTSTETQLALASTWRGFVFENDTISDEIPRPQSVVNLANNEPNQTFIDSYADKTVVHARNMRIYNGIDYVNDENIIEEDRLINDLKRAIVKNHGVYFGIYLGDCRSINYTSSTGVNYGSVYMFINDESMSGNSGHGMYIVGWDDDFEFTYPGHANPSGNPDKGVFILKNSWDVFSLIPQKRLMHWASYKNGGDTYALSSDFMAGEYMPAFSKYENNYFYDTGVSGVSMNSKVSITDKELSTNIKADVDVKYKKVLNVFKIRNDKEKAVAVSFYGNLNDREYEVALYRVPNDTNESQIYTAINNENNKLTSKTFNVFHGINVIDFDTPVDLLKGQYIAVVITADESNIGRIWVDGFGREEVDFSTSFNHSTEVKEKSFLAMPTLNFKNIYKNNALVAGDEFNTIRDNYSSDLANSMSCYKITNANVRIKLLTNNYVTIDTGTDGNINGNTTTYYYPTLKASMSDLPLPTVTNSSKRFVGYNTEADGSGTNYDRNSIYSLKIAEYLKLYAQYENVEAETEPSSAPSVAPTEPTPTTAPTTAWVPEQQGNNGGSRGGSSGGGGGGGGGRGGIPNNIVPSEIQNVVSKVTAKSNDIKINKVDSKAVTWVKDTLTNKWKLNVQNANSNANAVFGFYIIEKSLNNALIADTYYMDNEGNMLTGWLNTADDKWYFFDDTKTANEGKMSLGWKNIQNDWYYFTSNGSMMANGVTPDGYKVGADGKYQQ